MQSIHVTTSFGRRPAALGQVVEQLKVNRTLEQSPLHGSNTPSAVHKWSLFRTLTEIRERLGVSDRALSVLNALLSFHPETALTLPKPRAADADAPEQEGRLPCDLIVFPSNKMLSARAHGMTERTLLRHLTDLVTAGLIIRRDSPNGKRYARRDASGQDRFSHAYGFDLTPLVVRAAEFETYAEEGRAATRRRYLTKERISLLRRDVSKLVSLGLDEGLAGDWEELRLRAMGLMTPLRRIRDDRELAALETELALLQADIAKLLESNITSQDMTGNDRHFDVHQSNSNTKRYIDLEPPSREEGGEVAVDPADVEPPETTANNSDPFPLGMVMEACPDVKDYASAGKVRTWSDFLTAAAAVRPMLGISPDAWREAQDALGRVEAHVAVAIILQRSIHSSEAENLPRSGLSGEGRAEAEGGAITVNGSPAIRSAGGYLRSLSDKARAGEFALGPVLMATIGQRLKVKRGKGRAVQGGQEFEA